MNEDIERKNSGFDMSLLFGVGVLALLAAIVIYTAFNIKPDSSQEGATPNNIVTKQQTENTEHRVMKPVIDAEAPEKQSNTEKNTLKSPPDQDANVSPSDKDPDLP